MDEMDMLSDGSLGQGCKLFYDALKNGKFSNTYLPLDELHRDLTSWCSSISNIESKLLVFCHISPMLFFSSAQAHISQATIFTVTRRSISYSGYDKFPNSFNLYSKLENSVP